MNFFRRVGSLIRKELQSLFNDRSGRVLLFMPVVMQCLLFPFAATLEVKNASIAIYNEDQGTAAVELMQRCASSGAFTQFLSVQSQDQVEEVIAKRKALLAVRIPPDFSRKLAAGEDSPIQVVLDGRRSNSSQIAFGYFQNIVEQFSKDRAKTAGRVLPTEMVPRFWFNSNLDYVNYILPNLVAIITTIGALIITALSVAREREQGTFDQLMVSPLTPEMIMIGKAVPAIMVSFIQATMILVVAVFIYQVPFRGSLLLLYGGMFFYSLALIGVGLLISALSKTQQQAFLGAFAFMMPAILLSGFSSPVENMPHWLQILSWPNPVRHFVEIVKGVFLKDASLDRIISVIVPLAIISSFTLTTAAIMFRRKSA
ncbi:ABC transporter permease [Luteolibacter pohnpeiensis]|uniref:ABC transporter permease n=1 Tax=Luteolibacter pohnpeiensis TaxID=454153 RepID=A0A934S2V5_9BACT|nr:ABC transporter permease [Luteolibacter pohnpeiensis]MBK1881441.1 ABC transporter permease [Luteolibacter pohnpeiensis]